jgi:hypothetical protein
LADKSSTVNEIVYDFTKTASDIICKHATLKERSITVRPKLPWYSGYLKQLKQYKRSMEKIYLKDRSYLTKIVYNNVKTPILRQ